MKDHASLQSARAAKQRAVELLRPLIGADIAIGITRLDDEGFGLKVNLDDEPAAGIDLPDNVDGVPVQFEVVGRIRKLDRGNDPPGIISPLTQSPPVDERTADEPSNPPLATEHEWFLITHDWFSEAFIRDNPGAVAELDRFRQLVKSKHPQATVYEYLPIIGIELTDQELETYKSSRFVRWLVKPRYRFEYFAPVLKAFNALRSQTAHQMFGFLNHIRANGTLPNEAWEGGQWPAQAGYPRVSESDPSGVEMDVDRLIEVPPAIMPVINLSLGPKAAMEYLGAGDPVVLAQAALSGSHLLVVAAGNTGGMIAQPWARSDTLISVGATEDQAGKRLAVYSAIGEEDGEGSGPDVVAYGGPPFDGVDFLPGTSFAAPRVAQLAAVCQAAVAQLQRSWAVCSGRPNAGVPLVGVGIVDERQSSSRPRLDLPGLPFVGVVEAELHEKFWALIHDGIELRFEINYAALKQAIVGSARIMTGYAPAEVGAGFVSLDGLIEWLSQRNLAEITELWSSTVLTDKHRGMLEATLPFDADGLVLLAEFVIKSHPIWIYDLHHDRFSTNVAVPIDQYPAANEQAKATMRKKHGHADEVMWTDP